MTMDHHEHHHRPTRPLDRAKAVKTPAQFEFDLLAEMARDPANGLVEVAPGVYKPADYCVFCENDRTRGWRTSGPC